MIGISRVFVDYLLPISVTPLLLVISRTSAQNLLVTLLIGNPFTILLLFTVLDRVCNKSKKRCRTKTSLPSKGSKKTSPTSKSDVNPPSQFKIDNHINKPSRNSSNYQDYKHERHNINYSESKKLSYFRLWLISTHATLLYCFSAYNLPSLQFSFAEWNTLSLPYFILLIMLINLRNSIRVIKRRYDDARVPSGAHSNSRYGNSIEITSIKSPDCNLIADCDSLSDNHYENEIDVMNWVKKKNETQIFQELLFEPTLSVKIWRFRYKNSVNLRRITISENNDYQDVNNNNDEDEESQSHRLTNGDNPNDSDRATPSEPPKKSSLSFLSSITNVNLGYMIVCNILHIIIMLLYFYLNITFACASQILTRYLRFILIPTNCSYIFDEETNRITMFCATYSAQIFLTHSAFLVKASMYKEN